VGARRCNESTTARSGDDGAAVRQRPGCREKAGGKQAADSTVIPPSAISGVTMIPHAALLEGRATSGATSPTRDTRREASRRASPNGALRTLQLARGKGERVAPSNLSGATSPTRDTRREASRRASPNGALRTLQLARGKGERELPKLLQSTLDAPPKRTVQAGKAHAHEAEPRRYHRRPARQRSPTRRIEAPPNSCRRRSPVTPFPLKGGALNRVQVLMHEPQLSTSRRRGAKGGEAGEPKPPPPTAQPSCRCRRRLRARAHARAAGIDEPKERGGGRGERAKEAASDSAAPLPLPPPIACTADNRRAEGEGRGSRRAS